jgi:hypothetical protein
VPPVDLRQLRHRHERPRRSDVDVLISGEARG